MIVHHDRLVELHKEGFPYETHFSEHSVLHNKNGKNIVCFCHLLLKIKVSICLYQKID